MLTQRARFCGEAALGPSRSGHLTLAAAAPARPRDGSRRNGRQAGAGGLRRADHEVLHTNGESSSPRNNSTGGSMQTAWGVETRHAAQLSKSAIPSSECHTLPTRSRSASTAAASPASRSAPPPTSAASCRPWPPRSARGPSPPARPARSRAGTRPSEFLTNLVAADPCAHRRRGAGCSDWGRPSPSPPTASDRLR